MTLPLTPAAAARFARTTTEKVRDALASGDLRSLTTTDLAKWRRGLILAALSRRWPR